MNAPIAHTVTATDFGSSEANTRTVGNYCDGPDTAHVKDGTEERILKLAAIVAAGGRVFEEGSSLPAPKISDNSTEEKPKRDGRFVKGMVPTYADCSICHRLCFGGNYVPREDQYQSGVNIANGRTIAARVESDVPGHKRPVCSDCFKG